ncbi:hexose carrier protein HEX6-like isoform X2 [Phragmites australis]|uniref:hexose carrier protein HEX6-like isoform X2 n=1 Tax=Phragmites australis TaxID=29695 RepID=UPI002D78A023|nr:hexose carrier protein HEX6-like isoform X2 [Phragmites australis]
MAVSSIDAAGSKGRRYGGRITMFVALSCVTAAMGGAIFGYDLGTSGGVSSMGSFLKEFFPDVYRRMKGDVRVSNYCKFDSQLLTLFTSSLYISGLLTATLLSSWFTARHGRRPSMIIGGVAFLAGAAVSGAAVDVYMAILGRALLGVGLGFANQAVLLYLSEMAPARYRGAFSNGFQLTLCLGSLAANVINFGADKITGGWGWRLSLGLAGVPAAFFTLGAIFLPETPNSLVQQGLDRHKVKALLQKIRGTDAVDDELDDIVAANSVAQGGGNGLWLIVSQRRYRPQLVIAVLMPAFTQLSGINAIGFYAPVLLRTVGMGESASLLSTVVTVLIYTASTIVFMFVIDRFGRRTLLIAGSLQMLVSELLIGTIMAAKLGDEGGMGHAYAAALFVLLGVYVAGYSWSWGPMTWLVPTEVFPLEIRSAGQSITVASGFAFTIFVAQGFLAMLCRMKAWLFFFFAGWILAMTAFVYLFLPETKGLPIEQIGKVWREHWFWRRVVEVDQLHASDKL